jgi:antitoxin component YwqK of YwqJK toxin-antitoxin module
MTRNLKYILFSIILCLSFKNAMGCSCLYIKKISAEALMFDGIVFSGKIIDLQVKYATYKQETWVTDRIATFVVDSWYSSQEISDTVIVNTGGGGGDCGLFFNKGETWLIYANDYNGIIQSSSCTPSIDSTKESFISSIKYLNDLKSKSGNIKENLDWFNGLYTLSGKVEKGKPIGQWLRIRGNDTITVFNFNNDGKFHGYQMEKNEDWDETFVRFYETTDTYVRIFNSKKEPIVFYELKNGRRNGRYEVYAASRIIVKANYRNGRLNGDWTSWHDDTVIARGRIRTMNVFDNDKLISSIRIDEATGKQIE